MNWCRQQILAQYAQHLKEADLAALADATGGMSGRDLRDVCESAERRWAAQVGPSHWLCCVHARPQPGLAGSLLPALKANDLVLPCPRFTLVV